MKKIYLITLASFFTFLSCTKEEFLDKDPYNLLLSENVVTNIESLTSATYGAYNNFQNVYYNNSYVPILGDMMSDNVNATWSLLGNIDKYAPTNATDSYVKRVWDQIGKQIAHTSIVIREAEALDFGGDQTKANNLIGQLYVARSLAYFDMQKLFAQPYNFSSDASHLGATIVDENIIGNEIINPARAKTSVVYAKIITDIQKGITLIGDDTSSAYLLNKNSAKALLSRVYLYKEDWTNASTLASEVINSGKYSLVSNATYVASWAAETTTESIFSIKNTETDNGGTSAIPYLYGIPRFKATPDLVSAIDADDVRSNLIAANKALKYPAYSTRDNNTPLIRLSELYLIQAEALAELGGASEAAARTALNMILLRSNTAATAYTESGQALKDAIQHEKRKELMFEGHRLSDLTRKKKSFTKYSTSSLVPITVSYPNNYTILPIPQAEIDANTSISQSDQNTGY